MKTLIVFSILFVYKSSFSQCPNLHSLQPHFHEYGISVNDFENNYLEFETDFYCGYNFKLNDHSFGEKFWKLTTAMLDAGYEISTIRLSTSEGRDILVICKKPKSADSIMQSLQVRINTLLAKLYDDISNSLKEIPPLYQNEYTELLKKIAKEQTEEIKNFVRDEINKKDK